MKTGPTEDPEDENVALDPDEDVPWPDQQRVATWWAANRSRFSDGTRYLLGQPITQASLVHALRAGTQRQRAAAALELAAQEPSLALFETRARDWQMQALGLT